MEGHGAPQEPGHPRSSRSLAKTPDKAASLELLRSAPAKQLAAAGFLQRNTQSYRHHHTGHSTTRF